MIEEMNDDEEWRMTELKPASNSQWVVLKGREDVS
jgi:hypothetical protein